MEDEDKKRRGEVEEELWRSGVVLVVRPLVTKTWTVALLMVETFIKWLISTQQQWVKSQV